MSKYHNNSSQITTTNNCDLVTTYCFFDDLCKSLGLLKKNLKGGRPSCLSLSEIMTILLMQKEYTIENKKALYKYILKYHKTDFPRLGSYKSFCTTLNRLAPELLKIILILSQINKEKSGVLKFIDSTKLEVCKIWRVGKHKTMKFLVHKSKSTTGWYYGLKLHILCDQKGKMLALSFTSANVDDRIVLDQFLDQIQNSIIGADAGYISKDLQDKAKLNGNIILATVRSNMKTLATEFAGKVLNMRSIVETCFSTMKTRFNLVSTLARSVNGYLAHYIRVLFTYVFQDYYTVGV